MNVDDFRRMYVIELQELRSVEDQLVQALPKWFSSWSTRAYAPHSSFTSPKPDHSGIGSTNS